MLGKQDRIENDEIFFIGSLENETSYPIPKEKERSIHRLWVISGNKQAEHGGLLADSLRETLCFYPIGYLPELSVNLMHGYTIGFNQRFLQSNPNLRRIELLLNQSADLLPIIRDGAHWYNLFRSLCVCHEITVRESLRSNKFYDGLHCTLAANYLYDLLVTTIPWIIPPSQRSEMIRNFLELIEKHHQKEHGLQFYTKNLHVSDSILLKRCQKELGKSPSEVIYQRIIKTAKYLLIHTDLPIKEISDQLEFNSNAYFSERFKHFVRITPKAFRSLYRTGKE